MLLLISYSFNTSWWGKEENLLELQQLYICLTLALGQGRAFCVSHNDRKCGWCENGSGPSPLLSPGSGIPSWSKSVRPPTLNFSLGSIILCLGWTLVILQMVSSSCIVVLILILSWILLGFAYNLFLCISCLGLPLIGDRKMGYKSNKQTTEHYAYWFAHNF